AGPLVLRWLIDQVLREKDATKLLLGTLIYGVVMGGELACNYLGFFISYLATEKLAFRIRMASIRSLSGMSAEQQERLPPGELQYRIEQDIDRIGELGADIFPTVLRMFATAAMVLVTMSVLNVRLTLLIVPLMPLFYVLQRGYFGRLAISADLSQSSMGRFSAVLQEHLCGLIQLQLLNRTGFHGRKLARLAAQSVETRMQQRLAEIRFSAASMSILVLASTLILAYGGYQVIRGALTVGGLVAFYSYVSQLLQPMSIAVDLQARVQRVAASVRRVLQLSAAPVCRPDCPQTHLYSNANAALAFESVYFSHGARPALAGIDLVIGDGEKVAIVGHSGSGKSTILGLAAGLYAPCRGSVYLWGRNIATMSTRALRGRLALVPQDPVLFAGSVRENLLYGNPRATSSELEMVVEVAQLTELLARLPLGIDEPLGSLGRKLSGGEKQRIALARALLSRPQILLMDEVTGALDAQTSSRVLQALGEAHGGLTIVVVSHKPATITWAERICVVERGTIVDSGAHHELVARSLTYRYLWSDAPSSI
ncbi:MAG TPA: ABC transporter ATP-binding protein, partial [Candidatus Angelobacter sp.]|nr:ABC transporter ATP-binding protein [Candidatus Angelobacter sp.]